MPCPLQLLNFNARRLTDAIDKAFPWYEELHAFWKDLPNYNPIAITTSTPGTDHAADAAAAFEAFDKEESEPGQKKDDGGDEDDDEQEEEENAEEAETVRVLYCPVSFTC